MHARRVEPNLKSDWNLVPAQRNLTTKWDALCGDDVACKHAVDREKAGNVLSAELVDSATKLYEKLAKGYWLDSQGKRRRINHDFTKLQCRKHHKHAERFDSRHGLLIEEISWNSASSFTDGPCAFRCGYSIWNGTLLDYITEFEAFRTLHSTEQISPT